MTDFGNEDSAPQSEQKQMQQEISQALGEQRLSPAEVRQLIQIIKNPERQTEQSFLNDLKTRHGLTADEMRILLEVAPNAINTPARSLKQSAAMAMTEGSRRKREGTERLNSVTEKTIRAAVFALAGDNIEPTLSAVCQHIGNEQEGGAKLGHSLYQRLRFSSRLPETIRQRNAYDTAYDEVKAAKLKAAPPPDVPNPPSPPDEPDSEPPLKYPTAAGDADTPGEPAWDGLAVVEHQEPREFVAAVEPEVIVPTPPAEKPVIAIPASAPEPEAAESDRPKEWRVEKTPQDLMKALADDIEEMLERFPTIRSREWAQLGEAPTAINDLENRIVQQDNALLDLQDAATKSSWDDNTEREYRKIRANVISLKKELDGIAGGMSS
ncbi:MAG: hypothetical protein G01um10148_914 [Parcubacteria group bacterium Gr01-1014_8]|nr:MAG: hypothetical protein G01um10148_914 [Parcubacteria group bacterium Gr01-1014_8]